MIFSSPPTIIINNFSVLVNERLGVYPWGDKQFESLPHENPKLYFEEICIINLSNNFRKCVFNSFQYCFLNKWVFWLLLVIKNNDFFQFCLSFQHIIFWIFMRDWLRLLIVSRIFPKISSAHLILVLLISLNKYLFPRHAVLISALMSLSFFPKVATHTCLSTLNSPSGSCI